MEWSCLLYTSILLLWYPKRKESTPFRWDWTIICISIFLCAADFVYFYALSYEAVSYTHLFIIAKTRMPLKTLKQKILLVLLLFWRER